MQRQLNLKSMQEARGFTLMEVLLALLILGGSLVVLLGLQSSIIERTLRDTEKQRAMLLSREIFSTIETSAAPPVPQKTEGTFAEVLDAVSLGATPPNLEQDQDRDFRVFLEVSPIAVPGVSDDTLRKVELTVAWGEREADRFTTVYFTQSD
jgi:prepilin-type N-terminal cleavage/methylation domain-containing protein